MPVGSCTRSLPCSPSYSGVCASFYASCHGNSSTVGSCCNKIFWHTSQYDYFHEASHFAITHKPWVWRASTFVTDCINGISSLIEIYEHTYGHHIFTNIDRSDPDIKMINNGLDFWRIKPFQHWFPNYRFQHIYNNIVPILCSLATHHKTFTQFS